MRRSWDLPIRSEREVCRPVGFFPTFVSWDRSLAPAPGWEVIWCLVSPHTRSAQLQLACTPTDSPAPLRIPEEWACFREDPGWGSERSGARVASAEKAQGACVPGPGSRGRSPGEGADRPAATPSALPGLFLTRRSCGLAADRS